MLISEEDFAKYPFSKEAAEYVKEIDLKIDELNSSEYDRFIERAEQRVVEALIDGRVKRGDFVKKEIEILSFPIAIIFVAKIGDSFLKRRFALAESKRAYELFRTEDSQNLIEIAKTLFDWKARIKVVKIEKPQAVKVERFFLGLMDYLQNSNFQDNRWKLSNRMLIKGEVLLTRDEFARLLQEEVRRRIENIIENSPKIELSSKLERIAESINNILGKRRSELYLRKLPKSVVSAAYPPCIKKIYDDVLSGQHISHMGRFTLTSFLLNIGMTPEDLTKLYTSISDFDEKLTKYQIEHIAGEKGSKTKYKPPKCGTLKTHGLCPLTDDQCTWISHPLSYYEEKLKRVNKLPTDQK